MSNLPALKGKNAAQVVADTVSGMLAQRARVIEGIERGIAAVAEISSIWHGAQDRQQF